MEIAIAWIALGSICGAVFGKLFEKKEEEPKEKYEIDINIKGSINRK